MFFIRKLIFQQLRCYLVSRKNAEFILHEHERRNALMKKSRLKLMSILVDLIDDEFGGNATNTEIRFICEATVQLFPSLADEDGGIVSVFD